MARNRRGPARTDLHRTPRSSNLPLLRALQPSRRADELSRAFHGVRLRKWQRSRPAAAEPLRLSRVRPAEVGNLGPVDLLLIGWSSSDNRVRAAELGRSRNLRVRALRPQGLGLLTQLARRPPGVLVIDLDRLPSLGEDIGLAVRARRSTRRIPIVFAGGTPTKAELIRRLLPDARLTVGAGFRRPCERSCPIHQ